MSTHESEGLGGLGYWLPEESQFRLARLSDYIKFLARLAQPRVAAEELETAPEVRMGELAFCLEALAEQLDLVLRDLSWPAQRTMAAGVPERDATSAAAPDGLDANPERFTYGITLNQIDTLNRLIRTISAHGDVVAGSHAAELAGPTLPALGQAIFDGAAALRELLDQVEVQRLGRGPRPRSGVSEEPGTYAAGLVPLAVGGWLGPKVAASDMAAAGECQAVGCVQVH